MSNQINVGDLFAEFERTGGGGNFSLIDPGEYTFEVVGAKPRDTDIVVTLKVTEGPLAGQVTGTTHSVKGNAAGIFFQNMLAYGLPKEFLQGMEQLPAPQQLPTIAAALKGRIVRGMMEINMYNNSPRNQFKIGAIQCLAAPPLPAVGSIPAVAIAPPAAAPVPQALQALQADLPVGIAQPALLPASVIQVVPVAAVAPPVAPQAVPGAVLPVAEIAPQDAAPAAVPPPQPAAAPVVVQPEVQSVVAPVVAPQPEVSQAPLAAPVQGVVIADDAGF